MAWVRGKDIPYLIHFVPASVIHVYNETMCDAMFISSVYRILIICKDNYKWSKITINATYTGGSTNMAVVDASFCVGNAI